MSETAEQQALAYELYLSGKTQRTIAKELDLLPEQLRTWVKSGKWSQRRKENQEEVLTSVDEQYIEFVKQNRLRIAHEQLEVCDDIVKHVRKIFKSYKSGDNKKKTMHPTDLRELSRAAKDAMDTQARAVNITDKASIGLPSGETGTVRPQLLLNVGVTPIATDHQIDRPPINVTPKPLKGKAPF